MRDMPRDEDGTDNETQVAADVPPPPPYAPDPRLLDLMECGERMTDEEARAAVLGKKAHSAD